MNGQIKETRTQASSEQMPAPFSTPGFMITAFDEEELVRRIGNETRQ